MYMNIGKPCHCTEIPSCSLLLLIHHPPFQSVNSIVRFLCVVSLGVRLLGGPFEPQFTACIFSQIDVRGQRQSKGLCPVLWSEA